jgi:hypothetical protein
MKPQLGAAALAAVAALAVPALASAHPSVYATSANVVVPNSDPVTLEPQTRYLVNNHGFPILFRESNGLDSGSAGDLKLRGVIGYNLIPGAWRTGKTYAETMAVGGSTVQAHATCMTAALMDEAMIKSWQEGDAFYNYIPFQAAPAGLEDDPATWLPRLTAAGFDVSKLGDPVTAEAECKRRDAGATYFPADAVQTTSASLASGTIAHEVEPLQDQIADLEGERDALRATNVTLTADLAKAKADGATQVNANGALSSQVAALTADLGNARAELSAAKSRVTALETPLKVTLDSAKVKTGAAVTVSGLPSQAVAVTLSLKESTARKAKLSSSRIGKASATTGADGSVKVTVKLNKKAAKALKSLKGSLAVTAEATAGDRFATSSGKLSR